MMTTICASAMLNDPNFANIDLLEGRIRNTTKLQIHFIINISDTKFMLLLS